MKTIHHLTLKNNTREELLPDFSPEFPHISTCAELDKYAGGMAPWHWHNAIELFYIKSGCLEYTTPNGNWSFPTGSGGFINSNILHTSKIQQTEEANIQLLHLFDPLFLSSETTNRITRKYILPFISDSEIEIIPLYPDVPEHHVILEKIYHSFELSENDWGYEVKLRETLSSIWLMLLQVIQPQLTKSQCKHTSNELLKSMILYVHEHYNHPISIDALAESVHVSKRTCFRLFHNNLRITPTEYIKTYRLHCACHLLYNHDFTITQIAQHCGFSSSSYFTKVFREKFACTPADFRKQWHDSNNIRQD